MLQTANPETSNFYLMPTVGLYNEENYTFMNNVLQCLFTLDFFVIFFLKRSYLLKNANQQLCELLNQTLEGMQIQNQVFNAVKLKLHLELTDVNGSSFELLHYLIKTIQRETALDPKDTSNNFK